MDFNPLDWAPLAREIRHLNEKPYKYPLNQIDGIDWGGGYHKAQQGRIEWQVAV